MILHNKERIYKMKNRGKNKRNAITLTLLFIIFEIIFSAITGPFVVYYGPFKNVRDTIVGSAMTTLKSQWIATLFLSDGRIKEILGEQTVEVIVQTDLDGVKVEKKQDNSIERYNIKGKKYKGYILVISDPTRVKVGYSSLLGTEGQLTSDIARDNNAIAAVNGGGFTDSVSGVDWIGTGAKATGVIIANGKTISNDLKDENVKTDVAALTKAGKLLVGPHSLLEMKKLGVTEAVSFGPALIVDGQKTMSSGMGRWGTAGRTVIAQKKDGSIILLVIDGRQLGSFGATLREVQDLLYDEYGAYNAINLDGGSSSTMFYNEEVISSPSDSLGERTIPSIIFVERRD
jgi:exopolysaccharide biosynthesis protein